MINPKDIENKTFRTVRKGYSPDEVRAFLREVATASEPHPRAALVQVADEVAQVLESAHRTAAEIEENARLRALEIVREADETQASHLSDAKRIKMEAEVELANSRAESKRLRNELDTFVTRDRAAAEQARMDAESFAAAEQSRIRLLWENLNKETATRVGAAKDEAKRIREEADEANRILRAETDERVAILLAEAEETSRRRRERLDRDVQESLVNSEMQAAKIVGDAEARASRMIDLATLKAEEIERNAKVRASDHANEVLNKSQDRLDLMLAAEQRVHERLQLALAELQEAVNLIGGESAPLVARDEAAPARLAPQARRNPTEAAESAPAPAESFALEPDDRSTLSRLVGEGVGQALRPFQRG